jgi:LmbE family N-acetylglucosaminyl deacetylase
MENIILFIQIIGSGVPVNGQDKVNEALRIIAIGAHPDDVDPQIGGTAALFSEMGYHVEFVSVTNGDAGHFKKGGGIWPR